VVPPNFERRRQHLLIGRGVVQEDGFVDPQSHCQCGKGMQRRIAEKDPISCSGFGETDYQGLLTL
jgi:hypothetical protein